MNFTLPDYGKINLSAPIKLDRIADDPDLMELIKMIVALNEKIIVMNDRIIQALAQPKYWQKQD